MSKKLSAQEHSLHRRLVRDAQSHGTIPVAQRAGRTIYRQDYNIPRTRNMLMAIEHKMIGVKLRRKAYVCDGGQVQHVNDLGFGTITDAFIARPKDCKYCVFETLDNKAMLVDMFELTHSGNLLDLIVKEGTTHTFDSVDAAIMYALTIE